MVTHTFAQDISKYYSRFDLLSSPPSVYQDGLLGFVNPANIGLMQKPEARFYWTTDGPQTLSFNNWGIFCAGRYVGFGMYRQYQNGLGVTDYSLSTGFNFSTFSLGLSYNWAGNDKAYFDREKIMISSVIWRPGHRFSFALSGFWGLETKKQEGLFELGIRPFGNPRLTLFGDCLAFSQNNLDRYWSGGAIVQIFPGLSLTGRYFGTESFTLGITLDFGQGSMGGQAHYSSSSRHGYNSYMIRSGGFRNNIFQKELMKGSTFTSFALNGTVEHQKFLLFDDSTIRLYDLLRDIRAAALDPRISIIALNLTGLRIRPEHAWEVRQELKYAQENDKTIIAFIEQGYMTSYHLASVADEIVMDPQGMIMLPGLLMSRTYMKGTLDKLGLGFDEWRFFKYKSAYETYSRENFSEPDREQNLNFLNDWYDVIKKDVTQSRTGLKKGWDEIVDNETIFNAESARELGLVDRLDRWSNIEEIIKQVKNRKLVKMERKFLWDNVIINEQWGAQSKIAIIYGIGVCDMDSGIRARFLENVFLKMSKNNAIKAVVFRVDSPGGSGMASDVVADALKKCAENKPVIISQGQVAGSGGYWISMYGDKIYAGPTTITGSIGVIGGWVWDKGISDKLGLKADFVKRGSHADIEAGVTLPILGLTIPARNLDEQERAIIEKYMKTMYDDFVDKVAQGRNKSKDEIDKIAQGRFYSGLDGKENGLVDDIGGLMMALAAAKKECGLLADEKVEIIQVPKTRGLLDLFPGMSSTKQIEENPIFHYIQLICENPWQPLYLMSPEDYPGLDK